MGPWVVLVEWVWFVVSMAERKKAASRCPGGGLCRKAGPYVRTRTFLPPGVCLGFTRFSS